MCLSLFVRGACITSNGEKREYGEMNFTRAEHDRKAERRVRFRESIEEVEAAETVEENLSERAAEETHGEGSSSDGSSADTL